MTVLSQSSCKGSPHSIQNQILNPVQVLPLALSWQWFLQEPVQSVILTATHQLLLYQLQQMAGYEFDT